MAWRWQYKRPLAGLPIPSLLDRISNHIPTTSPGDPDDPAHPVLRARLADHLPALRATLSQQRRFRLQQLAELEAEIDRGTAPTNAADTARHEVTIKLAAAARQALADVDETLTLITAGRYGRCRGCHSEIPIHLLRTIPTTQWCLNCRQQHLPPPTVPARYADSCLAQPPEHRDATWRPNENSSHAVDMTVDARCLLVRRAERCRQTRQQVLTSVALTKTTATQGKTRTRTERRTQLLGRTPRRINMRPRQHPSQQDLLTKKAADPRKNTLTCGFTALHLWAKGDLNPHVPKDTGT